MSLSIIIPTLNEENYIGKLLDSLIVQTFKDFEVIVVGGNSKDNTIKEINKFKNRLNLKLIKNKGNLPSARNKGAKKAKFDLLLFLDADGTFDKDYLKNSLEEFNKRKLDFASSKINPSLNYWYYSIFYSSLNFFGVLLQKFQPMSHGCCTFIKKPLFRKIKGYNEKLTWLDDKELGKKAKKYGKFGILKTYIINSVRRFEKDGTKLTMRKWGKAYLEYLFGDIDDTNKIEYEFGVYGK